MFCTVLHNLKSPVNVGAIVRNYVVFGGSEIVFVGQDRPWKFKKRTQAFSRKLERRCELIYIPNDQDYFRWAEQCGYSSIAIEISNRAIPLRGFAFPKSSALVFGNEATGLSWEFMSRCHATLRIPQMGPLGSLNVASAVAIGLYELNRETSRELPKAGAKFQGEHGREWFTDKLQGGRKR